MKNKNQILSLDAQIFIDLCEKNAISSCAVVTSLRKETLAQSFCRHFCDKLNDLGKKTEIKNSSEISSFTADPDTFLLCFAPHPHENIEDYNSCKKCDAVLFIERYGYSKHHTFDEIVTFLNKHDISPLGVIVLKNR